MGKWLFADRHRNSSRRPPPDLILGLPMTQWPTETKERTRNKWDPPQHREAKPTQDNPPPAVLPPRRKDQADLRSPKKQIWKKGAKNSRKLRRPLTAKPTNVREHNNERRLQPAPTTQTTVTRSPWYPRAKQEEPTVLDRFVPIAGPEHTQSRPTKPSPTIVDHPRLT